MLAHEVRDGRTFKLIFDFDNYNQSGDDVWENWQKLREVTDAFHLKDSDKDNQHVPVGQGNGRIQEILSNALQMGWSGPLSVEPHLKRSEAVIDTGPHGRGNRSFAELSIAETFDIAARTAVELLDRIKADIQ